MRNLGFFSYVKLDKDVSAFVCLLFCISAEFNNMFLLIKIEYLECSIGIRFCDSLGIFTNSKINHINITQVPDF